jgi:glycosyltransferase involved in cell wall biosynthesis
MKGSFKPCYVWPNKSFPFRLYFDDEKARIFIIENLQHNFDWLKKFSPKFRRNDHFFVVLGWHYRRSLVEEASKMFEALDLNKDNFHILFNDPSEEGLFKAYGFAGETVNHNAFLDETLVMRPLSVDKKYDAIYVARLVEWKRHSLAAEVGNLALVAGNTHGAAAAAVVPPHAYLNSAPLTAEDVCKKINESCCGLVLSEEEGASFASSEYLLCGVPVVSTFSKGGRDVWYNEYNSRVVSPSPAAVKEGVEFFVANPRDPAIIRDQHIQQANQYRENFIGLLHRTLLGCEIDYIDAAKYFKAHFFHKMRRSYSPPFECIFG